MRKIFFSLTFLALACSGVDHAAPAVSRSTAGDTTIITSHAAVPIVRPGSVRVIWRSPDLEDPRAMARVGGRLVVADRRQLHVIDTATAAATTIGRDGEGPGEFRNLTAVAAWRGDSVITYDARLHRLSWFGPDLAFARAVRWTPRPPFVSPRRPLDALRPGDAGLYVVRVENVHVDRPTRSALLWVDPEADTSRTLGDWPDFASTRLDGGLIGPARFYGPHLRVALSPTLAVFAHGQGVDYCVTMEPLTVGPHAAGVRRVCRDWRATPTGPGLRHPDFSVIRDSDTRRLLANAAEQITMADHLPAYDALRFDEDGRLWVRTLGPAMADIHPWLLARVPGLGPAVRRWDVFDPDGILSQTVEVQAGFDPRLILADRAFGFYTLPTGEVVIGSVTLPAAH